MVTQIFNRFGNLSQAFFLIQVISYDFLSVRKHPAKLSSGSPASLVYTLTNLTLSQILGVKCECGHFYRYFTLWQMLEMSFRAQNKKNVNRLSV